MRFSAWRIEASENDEGILCARIATSATVPTPSSVAEPSAIPSNRVWTERPQNAARPTARVGVLLAVRRLLAGVHEHVALEQEEEEEADRHPGEDGVAAPVERLGEHVEERRTEHHARGEREEGDERAVLADHDGEQPAADGAEDDQA